MFLNSIHTFLTVRVSSSRLPNKCFLPFGDDSVLGHAINRTLYSGFIPIVCTSNDKTDDKIEDYCKEKNIKVFRGSLNNKLQRWLDCAQHYQIEYFHTIDVDDPFFDPEHVLESMDLLASHNLDVVYPTSTSSKGAATVGYSIRVSYLKDVVQNINESAEIEMVDEIFEKFEGTNSCKLISDLVDLNQVRLTLDYIEDYWLLSFLVRTLGRNCTRQQLVTFFNRNPDLYKINWFRNEEWEINQNRLRGLTQLRGYK
jgi:spore coat polysaccharide biosynthesis protein SpsF